MKFHLSKVKSYITLFQDWLITGLFFFSITVSYAQVPKPAHVGSIVSKGGGALLNGAFSVQVVGNYAYVVSIYSNSLEILDVSNPALPVHKGSLKNGTGGALLANPTSIFVSGNYAYVASGYSDALEIIDISNPSAPIHKGSIKDGTGGALLNYPYSVFVSGNYAYVVSLYTNSLEIVDVSNPGAPVHKGSITDGTGGAIISSPYSVYVSGNFAYLACNGVGALEIIDVSNPSSPVHKGSIKDGVGGASLYYANSVYVSANYAYVTSSYGNSLEIVDVSNPAAPVHKASIVDGAGGAMILNPTSVFVNGNYAYVNSFGTAIEIIDISNPGMPTHKSYLANGSGTSNNPRSAYVLGNYAYVVGGNAIEILDISNPTTPKQISQVLDTWTTGAAFLSSPESVYVVGNYAYVVGEGDNAIEIVDLHDPTHPVHIGSLKDGVGGAMLQYPRSVFVSGNYAYVASSGSNAIEIINISNPSSPFHAGSITDGTGGAMLQYPTAVFVSGGYAYVVVSGGLEIIDVSNPTSPVHKGSVSDPEAFAVFVSGKYAYIAAYTSDSIDIVDISNPSAPKIVGTIANGSGGAYLSSPQSIYVSGNYAYVACSLANALEILDVTNPAAPVHKGTIQDGAGGAMLNSPTYVFVLGNYAYVASNGSNALEVVDISNPASPKHAASIKNGAGGALLNFPTCIFVYGNYAAITSMNSMALEIVSILPPTIPAPPVATAATSISSNGFTANWNSSSGATSYQLDISTDNFTTFLSGYNSKTETGTSQIVTGLTVVTSYQYRIRASSTLGTSTNSNVISVTTPASITAPVATAATGVSSAGFIANWNSVSGAVNYQLDISSDGFSTFLTGYNSKAETGTSQIVTGLTAGTSYQYRVRATATSGTSTNSNSISVTTLTSIPAPVAITATEVSSSGFTANWNSVTGATNYVLDISTDNFATFIIGYNSAFETGTSQIVTGLSASTTYQYRVRVTIGSGTSVSSNVISATTLFSIFVPVAATATEVSFTGFTANWTSVSGAINYQLDISTDNFTTFITGYNSAPEFNISQIVTGLTISTTYQYRVRAITATGTSTNSNLISVTTLTSNSAPVATTATGVSSSGFTANWNSVSGATSYQLDISTDNFSTFITGYNSKTESGTSQIVTGLTAGTSYQYRVRITTASSISVSSNVISVTTQSSVAAPVATAATSISSTGFTANWNSVTGATSYQLDISSDNFTTFLTGYNSKIETGTSQIVTGLSAGTSYQYRVRITTSSGTSASSNVISATTLSPPPAPIALAATGYSSTGFTANWSSVSTATSYQLDISIDDFNTFIAGYNSKTVSGTFQMITGLTLGTTYKYRVRAVNGSVSSINSNVITTVTPTKSNQAITFIPIPDVTIGDPPISLSATATSGLTIAFKSSITPAALTGNTFAIILPGRDTITASQAGNATYFAASPVKQTFCINPAQPTVTISDDNTTAPTLTSSSNAGNQWFLDGVPISGATTKTLSITSPGVYTVTVKVDDCVSIPSDQVPLIVTGDLTSLSTQPTLYPSPTHDFIFISGIHETITTSSIIDPVGHNSSIMLEQQGDILKANLSGLSSGLYILQVNDGSQLHQIKFIKQ